MEIPTLIKIVAIIIVLLVDMLMVAVAILHWLYVQELQGFCDTRDIWGVVYSKIHANFYLATPHVFHLSQLYSPKSGRLNVDMKQAHAVEKPEPKYKGHRLPIPIRRALHLNWNQGEYQSQKKSDEISHHHHIEIAKNGTFETISEQSSRSEFSVVSNQSDGEPATVISHKDGPDSARPNIFHATIRRHQSSPNNYANEV